MAYYPATRKKRVICGYSDIAGAAQSAKVLLRRTRHVVDPLDIVLSHTRMANPAAARIVS
jgi:hypothetical protein